MNTERNSDILLRAAKHAALSDPTRLRIVDLLTLGDLSPSEIADLTSLPSNLVTHHIKALESVGIIGRSRSEADRRRTYLHLSENALGGLTPGVGRATQRVVFVCTANSARSQLAAALWREASPIPATSAGTHPADRIDVGAIDAASRHDLLLPDATPRQIDDVVAIDDLIVTVCDTAHEELVRPNGLHWSIADPGKIGTQAAFDSAYTELERRIADLAPRLVAAP